MCWKSKNVNIEEKNFAKEDYKCFKVVRYYGDGDTFRSIYMDFIYDVGMTYCHGSLLNIQKEQSLEYFHTSFSITEGFHSYTPWVHAYETNGNVFIMNKNNIIDDVKYPAFLIRKMPRFVKLNCTIPSGSEMYVNENGEVVSNAIRVDGFEEVEYPSLWKRLIIKVSNLIVNF